MIVFTVNETISGAIRFSYGEGSDCRNRKADTIEARIQIQLGDAYIQITSGTSKMVSDRNDPDFGRELAIFRALEAIAPVGVKTNVSLPIGEGVPVTGRELRKAVWTAWRTRRGKGEIAPVRDETRRAWREYRLWVRMHGRGSTPRTQAAAASVSEGV